MPMPIRNAIFAFVTLLIGIAYAVLAADLPERTIQNVPGPSFFPNIIAGIVIILSLSLLIKALFEWRRNPDLESHFTFQLKGSLIIVWIFLFVVALPYAGFILAGIPFFAGLMAICTESRWPGILLGSAIIPTSLYFLFHDGFNIILPSGQWF